MANTPTLISMTDTIYLPNDFEYLSSEYESYLEMMESETDRVYEIAKTARSKGLDFKTEVEIPRAKDLSLIHI